MKVPEVFPLIFDYETSADDRESKYQLIRAIIDNKLANKNNFKSVIENHETIVSEVSKVLNEEPEDIEALLVDIFNYPEVLDEYGDSLEKYVYETVDDDPIDTDEEEEDDDDEADADDEADDDDEDEDDEEEDYISISKPFIIVESDRLQALEKIVAINALVTVFVSALNIAALYYAYTYTL